MLFHQRKKVIHLLTNKWKQLLIHPKQDMNHQRERLLNNVLQGDHHPKNLVEDVRHNSLLGNGAEKNLRQGIHQSDHLDLLVIHPLSSQEVVELMTVVVENLEATHVSVIIINPGVDLHMIAIRSHLEADHEIVTGNHQEVDHENRSGIDRVSVLVDGADHHATDIDGAGHANNVGGVDHVIASGEADHVNGIGEEMHTELAVDVIEERIPILVIREMKAVILKSKLCDVLFYYQFCLLLKGSRL